jgi:hypothetical protein
MNNRIMVTALFLAAAGPLSAADTMPLAGPWRFQLDRASAGVAERWCERRLPDTVRLPGTLPGQGIGDPVTVETKWIGGIIDKSFFTAPEYAAYRQPGNVKVPFWLQPETYYAGAAWFQRDIEVPAAWRGRRIVLTLERPHWQTRVWLDDREVGAADSLSTPHVHDFGTAVLPGKHVLTIRVDNSVVVDVGENSHSISDHTQGNWNGIVGRIELTAGDPVWLEDVQVYPEIASRSVRVRAVLRNATGAAARGKISAFIEAGSGAAPLAVPPVSTNFNTAGDATPVELRVALGAGAQLWDEFSPALYRLRLEVRGEAGGVAVAGGQQVTFGLREIATDGTQVVVNGRKVFFRGTLECCIFPKTGHPPVEVAEWKRILGVARAHGLNLLRFHSWCPPEAAFVAADEMGFYFHVEAASWPNQSTTLGAGKPVDAWLEAETNRILRAYGNHPSFVLMASTNEPGGGKSANAYLAQWVARHKAADPRRLWTSGAGWPELAENQFHVLPKPRVQAWGDGLKSRINAKPPETRTDYRDFVAARQAPVVSHEIGQWCVYPNFDEIPKYTGYLKPRNFEIFRETLAAHGMADQARDFLRASGKLQALCYKEDIESALRTPGFGGFELLDLHDFPGQGTALVGVLDPFWEEKGYITPAEYKRFCNATVPLARLERRVFTTADKLDAALEIVHYGPAALSGAVVAWRLVADDGRAVAQGRLPAVDVPTGRLTAIGRVELPLGSVVAPARYKLVVAVDGAPFEIDWDVWVYPAAIATETPAGITLTDRLDAAAVAALDAGGTVVLAIPPARIKGDTRGPVALGFSSIFWNTAWTRRQAPHTLGILCDPKHPAFAAFPTDGHSNWQWWYLINGAGAMILDGLPRELRPVVQVVDDWVTNRKLGLAFESRVSRGRLLVCSFDLAKDDNPVSRQMRASLFRYVDSADFAPKVTVSVEQVRSLMKEP